MKYYNKTKVVFIASIVCLLSACATTPSYQSLNNQDKMAIKSSLILLNSTQREIVMQHNNWFNSELPDPYSPMDSGAVVHHNQAALPPNLLSMLIVAGIQNHQASTALNTMAPVRNALGDFDFLSYFDNELQTSVAKLPWLKVKKQQIKYNLNATESEVAFNSKEDTTLLIGITYALNSTFKELKVAAYVKLMQKGKRSEARTLYANNFFFMNYLPQPNSDFSYNKKRWMKDHAALLKNKLCDAASLLTNMIAKDMNNATYKSNLASKHLILHSVDGIRFNTKVIDKVNNYYITHLNTKELFAVNGDNVVITS